MAIEIITGIVGMVFILLAFLLGEFYAKFGAKSIIYNVFNIIGSGLLGYYAFALQVWPFVIINMVWFIGAFIKMVKIIYD